MQSGTHPSWLIITDVPKDLNFVMYVACSFNIIPEIVPFTKEQVWSAYHASISDDEEFKVLGPQWLQWWQDIVRDRVLNDLSGKWSR